MFNNKYNILCLKVNNVKITGIVLNLIIYNSVVLT